jgi:hypothetical protein
MGEGGQRKMRSFNKLGVGDISKRKRQFGDGKLGEKETTWEMTMEVPGGRKLIIVCSH